ncbi:MAG: hypothetical protein AAGK37_15615 [Pseudomonadota bacterium]
MDRETKRLAYAKAAEGHALKGKTQPYTAMNGNMFSFLAPDGTLAVRLADTDRADFEAQYGPAEVTQYGRVMRGYVAVPDTVIQDDTAFRALFVRSANFATTLKPKPTKR